MAKGAGASELQLDGGKKPKLKNGKRRTTKAQDATFFETLAQTCNVKLSARTAGVSPQNCYTRRQKDAAFRQRWAQALAEGYSKLEMVLLERAIVGSEKVTTYKDGTTSIVREYPNVLAMSLLKMHRETVRDIESEGCDARDVEEARARIASRLDKIARLVREREA